MTIPGPTYPMSFYCDKEFYAVAHSAAMETILQL
jgi:hypothetical protein